MYFGFTWIFPNYPQKKLFPPTVNMSVSLYLPPVSSAFLVFQFHRWKELVAQHLSYEWDKFSYAHLLLMFCFLWTSYLYLMYIFLINSLPFFVYSLAYRLSYTFIRLLSSMWFANFSSYNMYSVKPVDVFNIQKGFSFDAVRLSPLVYQLDFVSCKAAALKYRFLIPCLAVSAWDCIPDAETKANSLCLTFF